MIKLFNKFFIILLFVYNNIQMLSVSAGMDVGCGGHGGLASGGGGLESATAVGGGGPDGMQDAMVAAARDRAIRTGSVRQDLALDLPPRLQLPDGEERPYGAHAGLHLRDPEQVDFKLYFIYGKYLYLIFILFTNLIFFFFSFL